LKLSETKLNIFKYYIAACLIFSLNLAAASNCQTANDINITKSEISSNELPCHNNIEEDPKLSSNSSACNNLCCEAGCSHCDMSSVNTYVNINLNAVNYDFPSNKNNLLYYQQNYSFNNEKPITPPPIS